MSAIWQNCGGAGAMNTWSVPPAVLDGFCVYDAPRDGRVFNGPAEMQVPDMTVAKCKTYCFDQGNGLKADFYCIFNQESTNR